MRKIMNIIAVYFLPIVGTTGTAWQLSQERVASYVCFFLGLFFLVFSISIIQLSRRHFAITFITGTILLVFSARSFIIMTREELRSDLLKGYLIVKAGDTVDVLKSKADDNDGPAQYDLSTRFLIEKDYLNARIYAQKAADNGNALGYARLAIMYKEGLGCRVDIHQAVSNMIKAKQRDDIIFNDIFIIDSLSESDRLALKACEADMYLLNSIKDEIRNTSDLQYVLDCLNRHYYELAYLSSRGFVPASRLLYFREFFINPGGSDELKRLAELLYKVGDIPTAPMERFLFFNSISQMNEYNSNDYISSIQHTLPSVAPLGDVS